MKARRVSKKVPMFEYGGIIAGGVGHAEKNSIGDRGIPVVHAGLYLKKGGTYSKEQKEAEVESKEIVFNLKTADQIDKLIEEYAECGCPGKLVMLGQLVKEALKNTKDQTCRDSCEFEPKLKQIK